MQSGLHPGAGAGCRSEIMSFTAIGIDVGGTKIAGGLVEFPPGHVLARSRQPSEASRGGEAVLNDVLALARNLASEAKKLGRGVDTIGVGLCELVDADGNIRSSNCIHWLDSPVRSSLSAIAPAFIDADVRAAAFAEALFGAGRNHNSFLYVTIGTGISCCLMLNGKPLLGSHGATGTMGSSPISVPCENCGIIHERTLEEIASGPALVSRLNAKGGRVKNGEAVFAMAASGDAAALQVIQTAADALGSQLGLLINVLDPEAMVTGGGLGTSQGLYWDQFVAATRRHIWSPALRDLPIVRATTGADAGWLGAAASAWQKIEPSVAPSW
jgi:predicted NBD/HSP70 family sugar kinase